MRFDLAFTWMKHGKLMRTSGFKGYCLWDAEKKTIIMVTKNNERIDLRATNDLDFTLGFIFSDSWEFYKGHEDPRKNGNDDPVMEVGDFHIGWKSSTQPGNVDPNVLFKEPINNTYREESLFQTMLEKEIEEPNHKAKRLTIKPATVMSTVGDIPITEKYRCYIVEEIDEEEAPNSRDVVYRQICNHYNSAVSRTALDLAHFYIDATDREIHDHGFVDRAQVLEEARLQRERLGQDGSNAPNIEPSLTEQRNARSKTHGKTPDVSPEHGRKHDYNRPSDSWP